AALLLLTSAAMLEFEGPSQIIALSLIAALVPLVSIHLFNQEVSATLLFYFALPIMYSLTSITSPAWQTGILHNDSLALFGLDLCLWGTGLNLRYHIPDKLRPLTGQLKDATTIVIITAS